MADFGIRVDVYLHSDDSAPDPTQLDRIETKLDTLGVLMSDISQSVTDLKARLDADWQHALDVTAQLQASNDALTAQVADLQAQLVAASAAEAADAQAVADLQAQLDATNEANAAQAAADAQAVTDLNAIDLDPNFPVPTPPDVPPVEPPAPPQ